MQNKRVLLITLRSDIGGGPKHVLDLAQMLIHKYNFDVFIASPVSPPFGKIYQEISKAHFELPFRAFNLKAFFGLIQFCHQNNIQLIHSHGRGAGIYSRLMKLFGFKVIHTYHGIHCENGIIGRIKVIIDRMLESLTNKLIFVSEDEMLTARSYSLGKNEAKSCVVNNGITITPRNLPHPKTHLLGTLSRLTHAKGIDVLIDKMKYITNTHRNLGISLQIAGDGEDSEILKKAAPKEVTFLGMTTDPKGFLESLDVYVSSSRWEGLPLSVLEAMALKIPCILSEAPGHKTFIRSGVALSGETNEDFSQNVYRLLTDNDFNHTLVDKAYEYLLRNHTLELQAEKTLEVYASCT